MKLKDLLLRAVKPSIHSKFDQAILQIPEFDDESEQPEALLDHAELETLSGLALIIEYENSKKEKTQRIVTCKQLAVQGEAEYLKAYCHHRKAVRTFRVDRIVDVFDPKSGESLSPVQAFFAQFSPDKVTRSGLSWGLSVRKRADLIAMLNALVFIARCDRDFHPTERLVLETALSSFWLRMEVAGDPDFDDILGYATRLSPDGETFWLAMQRFSEDQTLSGIFRQQVRELIEADGVIREEEAYWALEIDEFLSCR
ncbi:MAG TPA: WYL domain-containing protein [Novosphingobium sp.]|nr:WYL domain-containing protein [Novosphingobium sp.]